MVGGIAASICALRVLCSMLAPGLAWGVHSRKFMADWPHSPSHRFTERGTYMVTAGTYGKQPTFGSRPRLSLLREMLMKLCLDHGWALQAWAVFPNHYHFVASSSSPGNLSTTIRRLHSLTAQAVNQRDREAGRKVWFQYWDTLLTTQNSYLARLHYVHENAVHHGIVRRAANYPWCSAGWFERKATAASRKNVFSVPCDKISVPDSFEVSIKV
jgi:putative transposase